ncbi:MAG: Peptide deformylase 2 [Candidatus Wolfebacteria bacterium GW2011_GWE2_44_13]|nr:MAG: Peptide deformylase 2 [Candidatus Wolfebacteria bacterium GW2011_GWE2_44_13]
MRRANGVGLSANQVGLDMQLFVAGIPQRNGRPKWYAIFNPKIERPSKEQFTMEEGCLSVPNTYGTVTRPKEIVLTGFDKHQRAVTIRATGLIARVFQHEVDHLNGIVFIDKAQNLHEGTVESDTEDTA